MITTTGTHRGISRSHAKVIHQTFSTILSPAMSITPPILLSACQRLAATPSSQSARSVASEIGNASHCRTGLCETEKPAATKSNRILAAVSRFAAWR